MKEVFGGMPRSRIALETGMHSPWVSRLLTFLATILTLIAPQRLAWRLCHNTNPSRSHAKIFSRSHRYERFDLKRRHDQ